MYLHSLKSCDIATPKSNLNAFTRSPSSDQRRWTTQSTDFGFDHWSLHYFSRPIAPSNSRSCFTPTKCVKTQTCTNCVPKNTFIFKMLAQHAFPRLLNKHQQYSPNSDVHRNALNLQFFHSFSHVAFDLQNTPYRNLFFALATSYQYLRPWSQGKLCSQHTALYSCPWHQLHSSSYWAAIWPVR